jgi:hypothetical protein
MKASCEKFVPLSTWGKYWLTEYARHDFKTNFVKNVGVKKKNKEQWFLTSVSQLKTIPP